jgi:hypothetical protein
MLPSNVGVAENTVHSMEEFQRERKAHWWNYKIPRLQTPGGRVDVGAAVPWEVAS